MPLQIETIPLLMDNYAYLLVDEATGTTGIVDPGEAGPVQRRLEARGLRLDWILTTHHHGDHTGGNEALKRTWGCRIVGPAAEAARIAQLDEPLAEGASFMLGQSEARIIETPGHTAGHIVFHFAADEALFSGDTLFVMGCGRLLERDASTMWRSLAKLMALPAATRVYCGHEYTAANARFARGIEPENAVLEAREAEIEAKRAKGRPTVPSTLAEEKATNPFLRAAEPSIRARLRLEGAADAEVFAEVRRRKDKA